MSERVAVVIVNANAGAYLERALEQLERQTVAPARVIVVDNASSDGSTEAVRTRFPQVELVEPGVNLGFAAANNLAIRLADDCELVALLNPDAFPEPRWLEELLAAARSHPAHAVFGSTLVSARDASLLDGTGDSYHRSGIAWRRDQFAASSLPREGGETFSACAAAALYRRDALVEVGGFDESFFCYYEDTDLAYRLRLVGRPCLHVPEAVALHVGSAVTGSLSPFTIYHSCRNQVWTWVKNTPWPLLLLSLPAHLLVNLLVVVSYARLGVGRAALAGKRDALLGLRRVLRERRAIQARRTSSSASVLRAMSPTRELRRAARRTRATLRPRSTAAAAVPARLPHLDGLRGLAALFVVLHHAWLTTWPDLFARRLPPGARQTAFLAYGHFAVVVFIVLSGFCLALPVARSGALAGGTRGFLRRRARRLLPPYYASVALSALLVWTLIGTRTGTHWDVSVPVDGHGYLGSAFLLNDVLGGGQLNHVWWSVALEWQIYFVFPLLVIVWLRRGIGPAVACAGAAAAAVLALVTAFPRAGALDLTGLHPWFLALFALGMLGAAVLAGGEPWLARLRERTPFGALALAGAAGVVALCAAAGRSWTLALHPALADLAVGAVTLCAIVSSSRGGPSLLRRVLASGWPRALGAFSYSLYLIHAPLLQVEWQYGLGGPAGSPGVAFALLALVGVPLVLAAAYGFHVLFERPFLSQSARRRAEAALPQPAPA